MASPDEDKKNEVGGTTKGAGRRGGHGGAGAQRVMVIASEYTTSSEGALPCVHRREDAPAVRKGCAEATKERRTREREGEGGTTTGRGTYLEANVTLL